jgi:hypothetical protein
MADAALQCVRRGLAVFPLPAWGRVPAPGWQQQATRNEAALPGMFAAGGNIGVACRASGVVVLDLDQHPDGPDGVSGWADLCAAHSSGSITTFTVLTPRGGRHVYFRVPAGAVIASSSGRRCGLPPGIDVRAPGTRSGGYVLGPGAQTEAGRYRSAHEYRSAHDIPVAPLPDWLHALLAAPRQG